MYIEQVADGLATGARTDRDTGEPATATTTATESLSDRGRGRSPKRRVDAELSPIIEIVNDEWAVTTYGLECLVTSYFISVDRLNEIDWVEHISEKTWATRDYIFEAIDEARLIHLGTRDHGVVARRR